MSLKGICRYRYRRCPGKLYCFNSSRARGRLNEDDGKVRVQDGVYLFRVQSVRVGLDRLCSGQDLNFKGVQRACTIIRFGQGENYTRIL